MGKLGIYVLRGLAIEPLTGMSGSPQLPVADRWLEAARIAFPKTKKRAGSDNKGATVYRPLPRRSQPAPCGYWCYCGDCGYWGYCGDCGYWGYCGYSGRTSRQWHAVDVYGARQSRRPSISATPQALRRDSRLHARWGSLAFHQ